MSGLEDARFWLDLSQWAISLGLGLLLFVIRRQLATNSRVDSLREEFSSRLSNLEAHQLQETRLLREAVARLESDLKHLPDIRTIQELHKQISRTAGLVEALDSHIERVAHQVSQLVENELRGG